jgi:hypothetical protein
VYTNDSGIGHERRREEDALESMIRDKQKMKIAVNDGFEHRDQVGGVTHSAGGTWKPKLIMCSEAD